MAYEASDQIHIGQACQYCAVVRVAAHMGGVIIVALRHFSPQLSERPKGRPCGASSLSGRAAKGGILRQPQWRRRQRGQELQPLGTVGLTQWGSCVRREPVLLLLSLLRGVKCHGPCRRAVNGVTPRQPVCLALP